MDNIPIYNANGLKAIVGSAKNGSLAPSNTYTVQDVIGSGNAWQDFGLQTFLQTGKITAEMREVLASVPFVLSSKINEIIAFLKNGDATQFIGSDGAKPVWKDLQISDIINLQTLLNDKANIIDVYTKTQSDTNYEPKNVNIQTHISSVANPHNVTKGQVGLGNVDNTSDVNKPISTATQTALNTKLSQSIADTLYSTIVPQILWVKTLADLPTPTDTGDGNGLAYHITQQVLKFANTGSLILPYTIVGDNGLIVNCETRQFVSFAGASGKSMFKAPNGAGLSFGQCFFQTITSVDGIPRSFVEGVVLSSFTCRATTLIDFNKSIYNVSVVTYCQIDGMAIRDNSILGGTGVPVAEGIWVNGLGINTTKIVVNIIDIQFAQLLTGTDKTYLKITGNIQSAQINAFSCQPRNNESGFYLTQNLGFVGIAISSCAIKPAAGTTGSALHPSSLTQKELGIVVSSSPDGSIPNSTFSFETTFQGNLTPTTIGALNTPTPLGSAIIRQSISSLSERMVFQDTITSFDSATNIITMSFTHNLIANDIVFFHTYSGTLPTGILPNKKYFIISPTSTTFKISETIGGTEIDFTTNGSGTLYLRHYSGNSNSGWIVNIGGLSSFHIDGISSVTISGTVDGVFRRVIMFSNSTTGTITPLTNGFGSSAFLNSSGGGAVTSGSSQISKDVILQTGEGILLYVERIAGTGNIIVANQIINFTKK